MDRAATTFGSELRRWRQQRRQTQMALAHSAGVSTRHLSWLEAGKSEPSRAMVLRLAECLDVPLRERNGLLVAAGYAPLYRASRWDDPRHGHLRVQLQALLDAHVPWPALAVDRHWQLVAHNGMVPLLLQFVAPALREPPLNVLRLTLHPHGLAPMIEDLPRWFAHMQARLQRQIAASGDAELVALYTELKRYAPPASEADREAPTTLAETLQLNTPLGQLRFVTTITVFGSPHDLLLSELAIETLLPADEATAVTLRSLKP